MRGERGFALVLTLMVTALLTALLVEFVSEVYVDTSHSHNFVASQQAGMLASSGVTGGIRLLQYDLATHTQYSSLLDLWAKPQQYDAGVGTVTVTIEEESGKMNINTATAPNGTPTPFTTPMAVRLLKKGGLSPDLMDAVMDWADENDTPNPSGAESAYYATLKPAYKAKNARLDTVEELGLLKGFTPGVVGKLRALFTVYGESQNDSMTRINVNTAPREVLASLDEELGDDLVGRILDYRKTKPIKNLAELNSIAGIQEISTRFNTYITYSGTVYRIHSEAKVGESVSVAEAVVRLSGNQPVFLYWREY